MPESVIQTKRTHMVVIQINSLESDIYDEAENDECVVIWDSDRLSFVWRLKTSLRTASIRPKTGSNGHERIFMQIALLSLNSLGLSLLIFFYLCLFIHRSTQFNLISLNDKKQTRGTEILSWTRSGSYKSWWITWKTENFSITRCYIKT